MGAFTNLPPLIDIQVDFIADAIQHAGKKGVFEVTQTAQDEWTDLCEKLCAASLFKKTHSWVSSSFPKLGSELSKSKARSFLK